MIELYKNRVVMDNDDYAKLIALWRAAWQEREAEANYHALACTETADRRDAATGSREEALDALGPPPTER